ncbi:hypothetical protein EV360DRAFT_88156 [Lentinula raphanica]|nr:hypothetical protein EV360DRAFT_88156 [Lentinula raphanica]
MRSHPKYALFIRKCDSTNDPEEYDTVTYDLARNLPDNSSLILVSTSILTVGIDIPNVRRVISLEPMDFTQEIQEGGRVLRQKKQGEIGEVYTYFSQATVDLATKMVDEDKQYKATGKKKQAPPVQGNRGDEEKSTRIALNLAYRIVADCLTAEQNSQYNRPPLNDDLCSCSSCADLHMEAGATSECISSCCCPGESEREKILSKEENPGASMLEAQVNPTPKPSRSEVRQHNRERRKMQLNLAGKETRSFITNQLHTLRDKLFDQYESHYPLFLPSNFIPDGTITVILDNFFKLDNPDTLGDLIKDYNMEREWILDIWENLRDSIPELLKIHEKHLEEKRRRAKEAREKSKMKNRTDIPPTQADPYDSDVDG